MQMVSEEDAAASTEGIYATDPCSISLRLLLVDEDPRRAAETTHLLADLGLLVLHARSADEALAWSGEGGIIAVLIEISLPTIDPAALATGIRLPRPRIPLIFLADRSVREVRLPQITGERVDMYVRPVAPDWLRTKIAEYASIYRNQLQLRKLRLESRRARREKARYVETLKRMERQQALVDGTLPVAFYCGPFEAFERRVIGGSVARFSGFGPSAFARNPNLWESRLHPEDGERVLDSLAGLKCGEALTLDYRWRSAAGEYLYMVDHCSRGCDGDSGEVMGVWLDVSERRALEMDRHHASKLETVGRLTGGIAHDFNNMLAVTINSLERMQSMIAERDVNWTRTQDALHAARDCAELTRRLVHLSRRDPMQASMIDLREHLPIMLDLVQRSVGRRIEVELDMPDDLPPVSLVRSQLDSAVLNLALNARDAMPDGGRLTVSLAAHASDGDPTGAGEPDRIELAVTDTGTGMQQEVLDKALDPFFTTKEENGSGLGLSMIQDFAVGAGGEIKIESREGEGTTVRLLLPTTPPAAT